MKLDPQIFEEGDSTRVEMIPLIDVVFLVLVAFIYASMFLTQRSGLPVDLPEADQAEATISKLVTVTLTKEGDVYLDGAIVALSDLADVLTDTHERQPEAMLVIEADREAQMMPLVAILDAARKAKIPDLTIAAHKLGNAPNALKVPEPVTTP